MTKVFEKMDLDILAEINIEKGRAEERARILKILEEFCPEHFMELKSQIHREGK